MLITVVRCSESNTYVRFSLFTDLFITLLTTLSTAFSLSHVFALFSLFSPFRNSIDYYILAIQHFSPTSISVGTPLRGLHNFSYRTLPFDRFSPVDTCSQLRKSCLQLYPQTLCQLGTYQKGEPKP